MQTPPPTPPNTPCPHRLVHYIYEKDCDTYWTPKARRSLAEIFELVMDDKEYKRKHRMTAGKLNFNKKEY